MQAKQSIIILMDQWASVRKMSRWPIVLVVSIRTLSDKSQFSILKVARSFFWAGEISRDGEEREKEILIYYHHYYNTKNMMCGKTLTSFLSSLPRVVVHYCSVASLPLRMILSCHHVTSTEKMRKTGFFYLSKDQNHYKVTYSIISCHVVWKNTAFT